MELTPGVIVTVVVVAVLSFVLIRWRRQEAAPPVDASYTAAGSNPTPARAARESQSLVDWLLDRAFEETGVRVADDPLARQRIAEAAAKALEELRTGDSAAINLPFITADARGPKHFTVELKRNPDSTFAVKR